MLTTDIARTIKTASDIFHRNPKRPSKFVDVVAYYKYMEACVKEAFVIEDKTEPHIESLIFLLLTGNLESAVEWANEVLA